MSYNQTNPNELLFTDDWCIPYVYEDKLQKHITLKILFEKYGVINILTQKPWR